MRNSLQQQQQQQQTPAMLEGRVFYRYQAFLALPADEQQQVLALVGFLEQNRVFRKHNVGFMRSVECVSRDQLVDLVFGYLEKRPQLMQQHLERQLAEDADDEYSGYSVRAVRVSMVATRWKKLVALQFIDRLVLSGFLAIHNEEESRVLRAKLEGFTSSDVLFVPTATGAIGNGNVSVWSLRANALVAGALKRASKLSKGSGGSDAYFVLDGKWKMLYWFDSDASMQAKGQIAVAGVKMQSSGPFLAGTPSFTVKVGPNLYMVGAEASEFVKPMISCGACFDPTSLELPAGPSAGSMAVKRGLMW